MAPKKQNGYSLYVRLWMKKNPGFSYDEAFQQAGSGWASLPEEEKKEYKDRAKQGNGGDLMSSPNPDWVRVPPMQQMKMWPQNSCMIRRSELHPSQAKRITVEEKYKDVEKRHDFVRDYVNSIPDDELMTRDFHVISFNVSLRTMQYEYVPIEVGIVRFNLLDGVKKAYHSFVDGGKGEVGLACSVNDHSQVHKIPLENFGFYPVPEMVANSTYKGHIESVTKNCVEIDEFIQTHPIIFNQPSSWDDCPIPVRPIFAPTDYNLESVLQVEGSFMRMAQEIDNPLFHKGFIALDLADLVTALYNRVAEKRIPYAVANRFLDVDSRIHVRKSTCELHDSLDSTQCALGYAFRASYSAMDLLSSVFSMEMDLDHKAYNQEPSRYNEPADLPYRRYNPLKAPESTAPEIIRIPGLSFDPESDPACRIPDRPEEMKIWDVVDDGKTWDSIRPEFLPEDPTIPPEELMARVSLEEGRGGRRGRGGRVRRANLLPG